MYETGTEQDQRVVLVLIMSDDTQILAQLMSLAQNIIIPFVPTSYLPYYHIMAKTNKKRKTSSSQYFQCMSCGYSFRNSDDSFNHKIESASDSCREDLHHCRNCSKAFLTVRGLHMHQIKSSKCLRVQNLEDTMSTIPFGSGSVHDVDLSDIESESVPSDDGYRSDLKNKEHDSKDDEMLLDVNGISFQVGREEKKKGRNYPQNVGLERSLLTTSLTYKTGLKQKKNNPNASFPIFTKYSKPSTLKCQSDCTSGR